MRPRIHATAASPAVRAIATAMVGIGTLLVVGAIFADQLGISGGGEGYGWKQLIATIVGLVLLLLGAGWLFQVPADRSRPSDSLHPQE